MADSVSNGLKITFAIHAVIGFVFGLAYLMLPEQTASLMNWTLTDVGLVRVLGAAILGFAAASWLAYGADTWAEVRIVVLMEIIWTIVGCVATVWAIQTGDLPPAGWLNVVLLAAFAGAFTLFYVRDRGE
jgi:hypothetical protein